MKVQGIIHTYDEDRRILTIKHRRHIVYYYMQNQLLKEFDKFLAPGHLISFEADAVAKVRRGIKAVQIHHFHRIKGLRYRVAKVFYDAALLQHEMLQTIVNHPAKLFLDVELSMQPYEKGVKFTQEIIQVGAVLEVNGTVIHHYSDYIKPQVHPQLTQRTKDFLHIDESVLVHARSAEEWYQTLATWMSTYQPQIYVWGRNDFLSMDTFYRLLGKPNLTPRNRFVDIMKMIKQFRHQKNDIGLLQCAIEMGHTVDKQVHDAFIDAQLTQFITHQFIEELKQVTSR
jgi:Inhibitor of the KinA pathway to sporulation, predicted exonuclease